ncbi:hypothetical protein [Gordonia terrae]|uniref:hypothetical protein n=1 Tax=Gordonia terrae TaxID=2055 RepID=UPI003F6B17CA
MDLQAVLDGNYFGHCVEGDGLYEALRFSVRALVETVEQQSDSAEELARKCHTALRALADADLSGAKGIEI